MATPQVIDMLRQALQTMGIGILGVFCVLAVFYITIKIMMSRTKDDAPPESEQQP